MLNKNSTALGLSPRWAITGLAVLSLTALFLTAWILIDFSRELEMLKELSSRLPASEQAEVTELAGELRSQWRLTLVLILNTLASSVAMTLLFRAYMSSETSLREAKGLATDILASIDQGIITTDEDAKILSINPCGESLLEQSLADTLSKSLGFPAGHTTLAEICQQVLVTHDAVRDKDYVAEYQGHPRNMRAGCSLLRDQRQRLIGTVIHVRDVTEKLLIEQRLRRMERYMSLGSLAAGLQHEIKNPLSALALHVQLLREEIGVEESSPETAAALKVLETETRRITKVLEGFRDFASVDKLNCLNVDLRETVGRVAQLVSPQAERQNVNIEIHSPRDGFPRILVDPVRIEQVLLNLVLNALAAMPEGGIVKVQLKHNNGSVNLDVVDNGPGIPEDMRDNVFDPYFTTRSKGTGMGLAICEKIVRQHNGSIDYRTSRCGTQFTVSLPRNQNIDPASAQVPGTA